MFSIFKIEFVWSFKGWSWSRHKVTASLGGPAPDIRVPVTIILYISGYQGTCNYYTVHFRISGYR